MTMNLRKVLYIGKAHTTGGRDGASRSSDKPRSRNSLAASSRMRSRFRATCSLVTFMD